MAEPAPRPADVSLSAPHADVLAEGRRLIEGIASRRILARLMGGVAIHLLAKSPGGPFARSPKDIDVFAHKDAAEPIAALLEESGYRPDDMFNALNGHRRLLYYDDANGRQLDVFIGEFVMCHRIPVGDRIGTVPHTLPRAELLLMKLQIFELNPKDQSDIFQLLANSEIGDHDEDAINARHVSALCAADWGLWRTTKLNLQRSAAALDAGSVDAQLAARLHGQLARLHQYLDAAPKGRKWALRAKVGDRVRWYDEPEEVGGPGA